MSSKIIDYDFDYTLIFSIMITITLQPRLRVINIILEILININNDIL